MKYKYWCKLKDWLRGSFLILVSLLLITSLCACNEVKTYQKDIPSNANVSIQTKKTSSNIFSSVVSSVKIYAINQSCQKSLKGQLAVGPSASRIHLQVDWYSYLEFHFKTGGIFNSNAGSVTHVGYMVPRKGKQYSISMIYYHDTYDVIIMGKTAKQAAKRVELLPKIYCVPKFKNKAKPKSKSKSKSKRVPLRHNDSTLA